MKLAVFDAFSVQKDEIDLKIVWKNENDVTSRKFIRFTQKKYLHLDIYHCVKFSIHIKILGVHQ